MGTLGDLVRVLAIVGGALCHRDDFSDGYHYQRAFPQDVMVDVINNFGLALLEAHNERNENNIALSPYGATSVLVALGEGLRGPAVYEIQDAARIPLDTSVIRIGLRDIHRHLKSYFIPKEGFLAGLTLSSENVPLNYDYEAVLRFYGYDVDSFNNPLYPDFDSTTQPNATEETSVETASVAEGKSTETDTTIAVTTTPIRTTVETTTETIPESESASVETSSVAEGMSTETESTTIASINDAATTPIRTSVETTTETNSESESASVKTTSVADGKSTKTESTTIASINDAATTPIRTSVETTTETNSESESASVKTTSVAEGKSTETESTTIASIKDETTTESNPESENTTMLKTTEVISTKLPTTASTESEKAAEITTTPKNEVNSETINGGTTTETITTDARATSSKESTTDEEKATTVTTTDILSTSNDSSNQRTTRQDKFSTLSISTVDSTPTDVTSASTEFNTEVATTIILKTESIPLGTNDSIDITTESGTTTEETITLEDSTLDVVIATSITKSVSTSISEEGTDVPSNDVEETTTETTNLTKTSRKSRSIVDYIIAKYHDNINDWGGAYVPDESPSFFIYGRIKEPNINFMTYDSVLPFAYIPMLNAMALSFPLDSKEYYLLLVLPVDIGGVDRVICDFKRTSLKEVVGSLKYTHVKAIIPSFMLKGYVVLTPTLQKLGIKRIFEPRHSDFSPMTMERDVYVTNIEQAVTVTIRNYVDPDKLPNYRSLQRFRPVEYKADRPFLYFVMDSRVHVCLMAGKIVNPLNSRIR